MESGVKAQGGGVEGSVVQVGCFLQVLMLGQSGSSGFGSCRAIEAAVVSHSCVAGVQTFTS